MSNDLRAELDKALAALGTPSITAPEVTNVVEPEPIIENVEPVVRSGEAIKVQTNVKQENKSQLFNWCKTRLNLVLLQSASKEEVAENENNPEFISVNGKTLWMNKPLSTFKIKSSDKGVPSTKHLGYLQAMYLPFAQQLSNVTKPNGVNQLGTEKEAMAFYKDMAISIVENMSRLLPSGECERFDIYCDITEETNSIVNDTVLDFYIVYRTDYLQNTLLERMKKIEEPVAKHGLISNHFGMTVSAIYPLSGEVPHDFTPWFAAGYSWENYLTTNYLPASAETRLNVLGKLPNTKTHAVPHIVLSKKL